MVPSQPDMASEPEPVDEADGQQHNEALHSSSTTHRACEPHGLLQNMPSALAVSVCQLCCAVPTLVPGLVVYSDEHAYLAAAVAAACCSKCVRSTC